MKLERVEIVSSPENRGLSRLTARVSYLDRTAEDYWFEVEREFEDTLSTLGNPWLACLLPLAMTIGEPLEISRPVDPLLYESAHHLMHIWKAWYPKLHMIPLRAAVAPSTGVAAGRGATFFSGGVDSFFTVVRHQGGQASDAIPLDDLIFVWGADISIGNSGAFNHARMALERAASELEKRLVPVATNLRQTRWAVTDWAHLSHGSLLGAIALVLESRFSTMMIASSTPYLRLRPWGSHPLTDPMFSTSRIRVIHDGAYLNRVEKLKELVHSDIAMRYLRVCWQSDSGDNCCACDKCYRTMAILEALGVLDKCATFRREEFQLERVARIYSKIPAMPTLRELESLARATDNHQLARAVRRSIRYSRRLQALLPILRRFKGNRIVSRVVNTLESRLLAGALS